MSILRYAHFLQFLLLLSPLLISVSGNTIFTNTKTIDETKGIVSTENIEEQAKNDCFANTLQGFILYERSVCMTDEDCVNICDCQASCVNTRNGGCTLPYNPDVDHICPYLHTKDGKTECELCSSD